MQGYSQAAETAVIEKLILDLSVVSKRQDALKKLSDYRETFTDLAPYLWHSFGTVAALVQEITCMYPFINPPTLSGSASARVCNALTLFQCIASHPDTRALLLKAQIPLLLYPYLQTSSKAKPFEYLRLTCLGVIGNLVKVDDSDVIRFLIQSEIIPLCLIIMESGTELSRTLATFIIQRILLDESGLQYICATAERFFAVGAVLGNMVTNLTEFPSLRLLKHIIRCYLRLSENARAREALRQCLPEQLKDSQIWVYLAKDGDAVQWLQELLNNVKQLGPSVPADQDTMRKLALAGQQPQQ